jgi:hypothetical protein
MKSEVERQSANHLLNALEPAAFERVAQRLTRVTLRPKQVVYKPNEPIDHVLFPENAVLCLITVMSNGYTIEASTVGREGASWISASVGAPSQAACSGDPGPSRNSVTSAHIRWSRAASRSHRDRCKAGHTARVIHGAVVDGQRLRARCQSRSRRPPRH